MKMTTRPTMRASARPTLQLAMLLTATILMSVMVTSHAAAAAATTGLRQST
eukprot:CAMPEP_0198131626 /NCGR_PEP_ID=MMETSP1442-20131203/56609_1 /TAXON_ID= /ORGANISM="Craspedostauros australis, Strain CCMP3328" /LENGTH=50 /DNA_ID=CAMNT_0043792477 /DNA_START=140 /DNA_END=288 /DNA_ORIENTATION=+